MKIKYLIGIIAIVVLAGVAVLVNRRGSQTASINSFEECAAAGYPIMESYPEQCRTPDGRVFVKQIAQQYSDLIQVDVPKTDEVVSSPLTVTGKARGSWYFEASFPVKLLDANGVVLAQAPAQAQGEWMTTEFVPFSVTLTFTRPTTPTGVLVLHNDNPSGLPENDKEVRIPVQFKSPAVSEHVSLGKAFTMSVGDEVVFDGGLHVKLAVINDSRCKPGVQCIWQGELAPVLRTQHELAEGAIGPVREVTLGTVTHQAVDDGGYHYVLQSAREQAATFVITLIQPTSGVSGYIHTGPTCPVEKNPPDPQCADRPYSGAVVDLLKGTTLEISTRADAAGKFTVMAGPGAYAIRVETPSALPRCSDISIVIKKSTITNVDIACDSGIR
jgi:hypothetical protein